MQSFKGLTDAQVEESRKQHGSNALTQVEKDPLWKKFLEGFKDPTLMVLLAAFAIQMILVFMGRGEWFEAAGVLVAVLVANTVSVVSENKQEGKAAILKAEALAKERVKVYRNGKLTEIGINDVVVGDVISLQAGDKIPADGILLDGKIKVDQSSLNGESDEAKKEPLGDNELGSIKETLNPYYVFRATVVTQGECLMEAKVVGDKSEYGQLALEMQEDQRETPLKVKLNKLADQISKFGMAGAAVIFIAFIGQNLMSGNIPADFYGWVGLVVDGIALAAVIIVMAVPEGLPMMISLVLSMNMGKMMKDNVLVRKLNGIETAGGLNILFSDKTGTITEGKLSVVELTTGAVEKFTEIGKLTPKYANDILYGIGVNNSASASDGNVIGGNSTDRALMTYVVSAGMADKLDGSHLKQFNAFDSAKKYSSATVEVDSKVYTYIKGAPERLIARCKTYMNTKGEKEKFGDKENKALMAYMDEQASKQMRMLGVAVREGDTDEGDDLTLVCILCIRDEVRAEAKQAIAEVKKAGVQVVMVTGDRKETAVAIAKDAGLLVEDTDIAVTSAVLNEKSDDEVKKMLPNLRVVARALPTDKSRLVRLAQELDLVVGMTGLARALAPYYGDIVCESF